MLTRLIEDTSRMPRAGETDGKEYHFVTRSDFENLVSKGKFIEYTQCMNESKFLTHINVSLA